MISLPSDTAPIVHFLYEPGDGGLDRAAIYLANGMADRGITTELWLTKTTGPLADIIAPTVKIRQVPCAAFNHRGANLAFQIPALARMIREIKPSAIISAGNQSNLHIALARNLSGIKTTKVIQKISNPIERPGPRRNLQWLRDWRFEKTSAIGDKTFVLSHAAERAYHAKYPSQAGKFVMSHLPCVTDEMMEIGARRIEKSPEEMPQLLAAGRLAEQKDYPVMLRALSLITDKKWHLNIIGDGPLRGDLQILAENLGLANRVNFVGFVKDVEPYFAQADLLLLSSRWEGLGAVAIEAYAMGCPVAATDCCKGLTDIISAAGYDTSPVGDHKAYANLIADILSRSVDPEALHNIANPYSIENSVDQHIKLLKQICKAN